MLKLSNIYEIKPTDFHSLVPKILLKLVIKLRPDHQSFLINITKKIKFCSPVSGEVIEIVRGQKRRILKVVISADNKNTYNSISIPPLNDLTRNDVIDIMCSNGVWPFIRQKPYDIIANPTDMPKSIFISSFNTAPLSIDNDFLLFMVKKNYFNMD